jgi:lysophospholipase L1-like esterase
VPASRRARLLALLISTLFALLVAEAALRIVGVSYPNFYEPDPRRGWALRPGASGWWTKEGHAWVQINGAGMRDEEHPTAKPAGEVRVALLGDSCTESLQVPLEQTFGKLLEKELAAQCPAVAGKRVETLNFGVSGYGTAQELLTLQDDVWKYDPDLVLLAFYTGNDVRNNWRPLEQDDSRPYYVPQTDGSLALDDAFLATSGYRMRRTFPARFLYAVFNHVRLLQLAKQAKSAVDGWIGAWKASKVEKGTAEHELGLDNAVYVPPDAEHPDWQSAWNATEAMLAAARDEAAAHRRPFGVVTLTTGMQVHPDREVRRKFMQQLGIDTLFYPDERIAAFGRQAGIPVLTLAPEMQRLAERDRVFFHGFANTGENEGHWNARGHQAAAAAMAGWVCERLAPP